MQKIFVVIACLALLPGCRNSSQKMDRPTTALTGAETCAPIPKPDYSGLITEYRKILAEYPDNLAVVMALGNAYAQTGNWKEALSQYDRACKLNPRSADVRVARGIACRNVGNARRAREEYQTALSLDPRNSDAYFYMGLLLANDFRDYRGAIGYWESLLVVSPHDRRSQWIRSRIQILGRTPKEGH